MPDPAPYDTDIALWAAEQARLLHLRRFDEIDMLHVAREIEGLATRQRAALRDHLAALVARLVMWKYLPGARLPSWRADASDERCAIARLLAHSPSLSGSLDGVFPDAYRAGRLRAAAETGIDVDLLPVAPPFTLAQVRDEAFMPLEPDRETYVLEP